MKPSFLDTGSEITPGVNPKDIFAPMQVPPGVAIGSAPDSIASTVPFTSQARHRSSSNSKASRSEQSRRTSPRKAAQASTSSEERTLSQRQMDKDLARLAEAKARAQAVPKRRPKSTVKVEKERAEKAAKDAEAGQNGLLRAQSSSRARINARPGEDEEDEILLRPTKKAKIEATSNKPISKALAARSPRVIDDDDDSANSDSQATDEETWAAKRTEAVNAKEEDEDGDWGGDGTQHRWSKKVWEKASAADKGKKAAPTSKSKVKAAPKGKGKAKAVDGDADDDDLPIVARRSRISASASKASSTTTSRRQSAIRDSTADPDDDVPVTTIRKTARLPETLAIAESSIARKGASSARLAAKAGKETDKAYRTSAFVEHSDANEEDDLAGATEVEYQPQADRAVSKSKTPTATYGKKGKAADASQAANTNESRAAVVDSNEEDEDKHGTVDDPLIANKVPTPPAMASHIEIVIEKPPSRKSSSSSAAPAPVTDAVKPPKSKDASPAKASGRASRSASASQTPAKKATQAASKDRKTAIAKKAAVAESDEEEEEDDVVSASELGEASEDEKRLEGKKTISKPAKKEAKKASPANKKSKVAENPVTIELPKAGPLAVKVCRSDGSEKAGG